MTKGEEILTLEAYKILLHQFYFMSMIVTQVGYGDAMALPPDGIKGNDLIVIYFCMLFGLIVWLFPQSFLTITF